MTWKDLLSTGVNKSEHKDKPILLYVDERWILIIAIIIL